MISVEHLMEIQERLHSGDNLDDVFNDVYELGRADAIDECIVLANSRYWVTMPQLTSAMEQLKEQTNE